MPFQLSSPGSPGLAIVPSRHASAPVCCVEADDLRPADLRGDARARRADHDLAARDERPAVQALAPAEVADLRVPHDFAGRDVERDDVHVRRAEIEPVAVQREAALVKRRRALLERVRVLPEQVAGLRIERLHDVAVRLHEDRAVAHERHAFRAARRHRPAPREAQVLRRCACRSRAAG